MTMEDGKIRGIVGTKERLLGFSQAAGAFLALIVLIAVLAVIAPNFLTSRNLLNVIDQVTVLGVVSLGMTVVIITGGIDLSVGSVLALSTMVLGWLSHFGGFGMGMAISVSLLVGLACGMLNGVSITYGKLPPFIGTLAMMSIARGLANLITNGRQIIGYPEWFFQLSSKRYQGYIAITALVLVLVYVVGWLILQYRRSGRAVYAIGGGAEVARLAGIAVNRVTIGVYAVAGLLSALGGIILASRLDSSQPTAGQGLELDCIAAVVIGGASLSGGKGSLVGTIVGVFIIGVLRNGLNLLSVSPFIQQVVIGLVIAGAVMSDVLRERKN